MSLLPTSGPADAIDAAVDESEGSPAMFARMSLEKACEVGWYSHRA
jgi:hypothetical protein